MKILAIETSCDETSAAIVEDGSTIISNVVSSQIEIHARYGGIVPEVASRQHLLTILPVLNKTLYDAKLGWNDLAAIAVTYGPGLAGSLLVGVNIAKAIAWANGLPLIGINHLEGHIYANWLNHVQPEFPCLCLIVSGGHSDLLLMADHGQFKIIGRTRDDAAGEAFDKGARILGLGYPGGPAIEKAAHGAKPSFPLPRAWLKGTDDFSFSGLKTSLLHLTQSSEDTVSHQVAEIAASFQQAIIEVLTIKTIQSAERFKVKQILLSGGVAANKALGNCFIKNSPLPVLIPSPSFCTDNAAMIASCGYFHYKADKLTSYDLDVVPSLNFGQD
jgi:N6-L-threonylcarbamoyladenine synthase